MNYRDFKIDMENREWDFYIDQFNRLLTLYNTNVANSVKYNDPWFLNNAKNVYDRMQNIVNKYPAHLKMPARRH